MINQLETILNSIPEEKEGVGIKKPVMIIDDNLDVIEALSVILSKKYNLITCHSFEQTIQQMIPEISVVLLDIKMAYKNGIEVFSLLNAGYPHLKIIFHSAYPGNDEQALLAESLPHAGYLTKGDYDITELLQTIERAF